MALAGQLKHWLRPVRGIKSLDDLHSSHSRLPSLGETVPTRHIGHAAEVLPVTFMYLPDEHRVQLT